MKTISVEQIGDCKWHESAQFPNIRWKYLVDSTKMRSHGVSCGIIEISIGAELTLHHHEPQEIYVIRAGEALLLQATEEPKKLLKDSVIYIPESCSHGVRNIGQTSLELLWIFPTNSWEEIDYMFK
ncbi:MAG: cupin domain-containing protein [Pseudomonadota bacterium]|nr:cupin domain-containing protein [Pseudomonadota bacterium]